MDPPSPPAPGVFLPAALSPRTLVSSFVLRKPESGPSPLPTLVGVVAESIAEVALLCAVGWFLAHKGIVDAKAKKTLNKINTSLFTPCLLFNKVAFSLTPDKLAELYIIPIGFVLVSAFSAAIAYLLGRVFRLKPGQRNFAIACATFQNSNSLPIALLQSLIGEKLPLQWGPHDTRDAMLGRGLSYLVLFSSLGIIVRWSIGVRLLTSAESQNDAGEVVVPSATAPDPERTAVAPYELREDEADGAAENDHLLGAGHARNGGASHETARTRESSDTTIVGRDNNGPTKPRPKRNGSRVFQSFPNSPLPSVSSRGELNGASASNSDDEDEDEDDEEDPLHANEQAEWGARRGFGRRFLDSGRMARVRRLARKTRHKLARFWTKFSDFMTVPLWAAVLSLVVACIPPLQATLNHAEPLKASIRSAGSCSVPITLITLGAYFYSPSAAAAAETSPLRPEERELPPSERSPHRPPASFSRALLVRLRNPFAPLNHTPELGRMMVPQGTGRGETRTVIVAVVSRMVIVPLVLIPLFAWYAKLTVNVADDPVFVVVTCLLIGSPSAITLAQLSSSASGQTFERLISRTLFVSYAILTAPTTILLVLAALAINNLQHPEMG